MIAAMASDVVAAVSVSSTDSSGAPPGSGNPLSRLDGVHWRRSAQVVEGVGEGPRRLPLPNPRRVLRDGLKKAAEKQTDAADGKLGVNRRPPGAVVPVPPNLCGELDKAGIVAEVLSPIEGGGACKIRQPIRYSRVGTKYSVGLSVPAISTCRLARQFVAWLDHVVQPAALKVYDQPVVRVSVTASYVCRPGEGKGNGKMSQYGVGNAIDVSEFAFADGSSVSVLFGWADKDKGQKFLREIHAQACRYFTTVIGPDGDRWHSDHIQLDLAKRDDAARICE